MSRLSMWAGPCTLWLAGALTPQLAFAQEGAEALAPADVPEEETAPAPPSPRGDERSALEERRRAQATAHEPALRNDQKRPAPALGAPAPAGPHGLLWVPRVALWPAFALWNYGVRKPLGWLTSTAERDQWPTKILDFFTFGDDRRGGIVPTALFDFGIKPSVGVFAFWNGVLLPHNDVSVNFGTWGPKWINVGFTDSLRIGPESKLQLSVRYNHRPDVPFYGIGPQSRTDDRVRYTFRSLDVGVGADVSPTSDELIEKLNAGADAPPAHLLRVITRVGVRLGSFGDGRADDDAPPPGTPPAPGLELDDMPIKQAIRDGHLPAPAGYGQFYLAAYQRLEVQLDTRKRRPLSQTGVRATVELEHAQDLSHGAANSWLRYGGSLGGFVDVGRSRSLGLIAAAVFVDPLRGHVPFTENVVFGGSHYMRGFLWNRLNDRSGAVLTAEYRWPIWVFVDGTAQFALGNVFGERLESFKPSLLRMSGAIGLRSANTPGQSFEVLLGVGTEPFADGASPTSMRLVFGTSQF